MRRRLIAGDAMRIADDGIDLNVAWRSSDNWRGGSMYRRAMHGSFLGLPLWRRDANLRKILSDGRRLSVSRIGYQHHGGNADHRSAPPYY
ncbi:hypothetical protein NWI01_31240 [Nitrobacter winogradskyi]|uniref:Uncharacterized protein n=1 Tax=Nitrobacter winogradskyi TaxID=913 RepID=A0A4Y3WDY9_NITWI|nr:hypothetical protein NWI01_31240 [Nitrobacter winogradskyi]